MRHYRPIKANVREDNKASGIIRVQPVATLTTMQYAVAEMLGLRVEVAAIAEAFGVSSDQVVQYIAGAAKKIPGDWPRATRLGLWARGATLDVLQGDSLRYELSMRARHGYFRPHVSPVAPHPPASTDDADGNGKR